MTDGLHPRNWSTSLVIGTRLASYILRSLSGKEMMSLSASLLVCHCSHSSICEVIAYGLLMPPAALKYS